MHCQYRHPNQLMVPLVLHADDMTTEMRAAHMTMVVTPTSTWSVQHIHPDGRLVATAVEQLSNAVTRSSVTIAPSTVTVALVVAQQ